VTGRPGGGHREESLCFYFLTVVSALALMVVSVAFLAFLVHFKPLLVLVHTSDPDFFPAIVHFAPALAAGAAKLGAAIMKPSPAVIATTATL
jgi:hypothetical protein